MKVMISQPMKNLTEKQILNKRNEIKDKLNQLGWEVIDTLFKEETPRNCNAGAYYLAKSIEAISRVDAVLFVNGWEKARGCKIEHEICLQYNIPTMYEYEI